MRGSKLVSRLGIWLEPAAGMPRSLVLDPVEALRREIHGGLQVVENWNSANEVVFYGKDGKLTGSDREHVEVSMLTLHLLQSCLVHIYINTLLRQRVLDDPKWTNRLTEEDRRGLNALFWTNVNPYDRFQLDMDTRLDLAV